MKTIFFLPFVLFVFSCGDVSPGPVSTDQSMDLKPDTLNVALLTFDYDSTEFLGGVLYHDNGGNVLVDSFPLGMEYDDQTPQDGPFTLLLTLPMSGDTLFHYKYYAWTQITDLKVPASFTNPIYFASNYINLRDPFYTETIASFVSDTSQVFIEKYAALMEEAKTLDITAQFAKRDYQVFTCLLPMNEKLRWFLLLCAVP